MCAGVTAKSIRLPFLHIVLFFSLKCTESALELKLEGPHRDRHFILNMDQMPVFFCITRKETLEVIGVKTVHICTSTNDTKHATMAVTIAADGSKFFGGGGDENITINHGCGGGDCGGSGNSDVKAVAMTPPLPLPWQQGQ